MEIGQLSKNKYFKISIFLFITIAGLFLITWLLDLFFDVLQGFRNNKLAPYDNKIEDFIFSLRNNSLTTFFKMITMFGDVRIYFILVIGLLALIYKKYKSVNKAIQATIFLILGGAINHILKDIIERSRPFGNNLVETSSSSFPSGHGLSSLIFYGFIIYLLWRSSLQFKLKFPLTILLILMIMLIGISRIYLGVHHPTDVLAGWLAGGAFLCFFILISYSTRFIKNNHH